MTGTRVLYISGSIGLGYARRDLAIARELRRLDPEVEIMWLAESGCKQEPGGRAEDEGPQAYLYRMFGLADIQRRPALVV